ncbi:MAG: glycogen debranching protein GlgX [Spirochaetaceae bacterium]|jgi:glycogen operon protein|nr:glycogen debranching protein GlgX [Spirochaetaceae bacterium]
MAFGDFAVKEGKPLPLGASLRTDGVNFSIFSRNAQTITLVLFENAAADAKRQEITLAPGKNRTGDVWHCFIPGLTAGAYYLYRADGPFQPEKGLRFNKNRALIDPYAKALSNVSAWDFSGALAYQPDDPQKDLSYNTNDNINTSPRCIVIDNTFDWQNDRPLNYPLRHSIIYETHVRGLTMSPTSGAEHPGTYLGVVEKIPYLKELGITSLELLPIHEFYENELSAINPRTGEKLKNYWGYSTVAFFAPKASYSSKQDNGEQVNEFKTMVRELHKAGIEVILDVVFNHTAEGNELGPTFSFRGLDNQIYYILNDNRRYYQNYSGCGNTVNCNNPVMRGMIIDCLNYWVVEMHIDGFRFDLGSILGRDQKGRLMENAPMLEKIAEEPVLRHTKIIAEAWDAGGAYQVGWFPGRWAEWNDRFRDDVRRFWRGDPGTVREMATRLSGSSDLYLRDGRKPFHSINFFACHDGFTLKDLVTYNFKHNEENGEGNRDGNNNNLSYNYGYEGPSLNPAIETVRQQQMKNFIATLMISQGTPMLLGGDEFARTQKGCNNAYCQDNEISWYDWTLKSQNYGLFRFAKEMIAFRHRHQGFMRPEFYTGREGSYNGLPDITWYDEEGKSLDWERKDTCFALYMDGTKADILADRDDNDFYIMFNAGVNDCKFIICPPPAGKGWRRAVDTSLTSPDDIKLPDEQDDLCKTNEYLVRGRSIVILLSK